MYRVPLLAIMIVMRRERLRTSIAGQAENACRLGIHQDSPLMSAIPAAVHQAFLHDLEPKRSFRGQRRFDAFT